MNHRKIDGFLSLLSLFVLLTFLPTLANASHFRFGHLTWSRIQDNPDGSVEVRFTYLQAWRTSALSSSDVPLPIDPGDSSGQITPPPYTDLGTFMDVSGEEYTILSYSVNHTYQSAGQYLAESGGCCRIGSLVNASSASEKVEAYVDLTGGNLGSPISNIPVILQMAQGEVNTINLPIADPDLDPTSCRMATVSESSIPSVVQAGGQTLEVSSACVLSWDTSGTTVGEKYAVQVAINEDNRCTGEECGRVSLDFIIEIVDGNPPKCTTNSSTQNIVYAGETFQADFTGTDMDQGEMLTVNMLGAPGNAMLTPANNTTQAPPFNVQFSWQATQADRGSAYSVLIVYTDEIGLQGTCTFSVSVPDNEPPLCAIDDDLSNLFCEGATTQVPLNATSVSDPDGDPVTYAWSTDCTNAIIADDKAEMTSMELSDPGAGLAQSCNVFLTVSDPRQASSECQTIVNVEACGFDCNGVPNGPSELDQCGVCGGDGSTIDVCGVCGGDGSSMDECGVCGGDGSSCACTMVQYDTSTLTEVSNDQKKTLRKWIRENRRNCGKARGAKIRRKARKILKGLRADLAYLSSVPSMVEVCRDTSQCVTSNNTSSIEAYSSNSEEFAKQMQRLVNKRMRCGRGDGVCSGDSTRRCRRRVRKRLRRYVNAKVEARQMNVKVQSNKFLLPETVVNCQ